MYKGLIVVMTAATMAAAMPPAPAQAGGRGVAAGVIGGFAVGTMFGAAIAQPRPYYGPGPVYVAPAPVYVGPRRCYWTRGEPVWDSYYGVWRRPRMRVCH